MIQQQAISSAATSFSPGEWMRIFATRLARDRPELPADAIVSVAVNEFRSSYNLPPEIAVRSCGAVRCDD